MANVLSRVAAALLLLGLPADPALALSSRTFVSAATGSDANDCSGRSTPCRTFQGAHDKTDQDGEVIVLDPGGYGGLTITKSISIVNDGVGEAGILVSGGAVGITINAGPASYVNLRGITIQGIGFGGGSGLTFNSGFALTITNCVVRNHTSFGIGFMAASGSLAISNTLVADNGGTGILVEPSGAGAVKAVFHRIRSVGNSGSGVALIGDHLTGTVNASVSDSMIANNAFVGLLVGSGTGRAASVLTVVRSVSANNDAFGLAASGASAILRVGRSAIVGNAGTWTAIDGGVVQSFVDNQIDGNRDGNLAPPPIGRK